MIWKKAISHFSLPNKATKRSARDMYEQSVHDFGPFNFAHWWQIVENFAQGDRIEWNQLRADQQYEYIRKLAEELYIAKRQIEERQSLGRLYFVPSFLNHSTNFDVHSPEEKPYREAAQNVYKRLVFIRDNRKKIELYIRYPILLFAAQSIECNGNMTFRDQVQKLTLSIIAQSAVREWPVEMYKNGHRFFWDRMRLFLCKKDKASQSTITYQIRFLALVHRKDFSFKELVNGAVAYHFLEEIGKDVQVFIERQQKHEKKEKSVGYVYVKEKSGATPPDRKIPRRNEIQEEGEIVTSNEDVKGSMAAVIRCTPDRTNEFSKLWKNFGGDDSYSHFTIQFETAACKSSEGAGTNKYQIYTEIELSTQYGTVFMGDSPRSPAPNLQCYGLLSLPFELASNPSTHPEGHFFQFAWPILTHFYNVNRKTSSGESVGLNWAQLSPWFEGLIAAQSNRYCRKMDDSEMRSFRRMILMNRVMKAAGQDGAEQSYLWNDAVRERLQNLEIQMFGAVLTGKQEAQSMHRYLSGISKILRQATLEKEFVITEEDLNQCCWYVNRDLTKFVRTSFTPVRWLLNAATIICDESESLHKEELKDKGKFTINMYNDGYISLRPADSASIITRVVTDKMKAYKPGINNVPPMPTLFLRIDESELGKLCIEYSGLYEKIDNSIRVTEPNFGRIAVEVLKNKRFYPKDLQVPFVKTKKNESIQGLKAFFMQGYPSRFKKIMRVKEESNVTGMKVFIFPIDREGVTSLYDKKEEVEAMEENEVDPMIGPYDPFNGLVNETGEALSQMSFDSGKALRARQRQLRQQYSSPFWLQGMSMSMSPAIDYPLSMEGVSQGSPHIQTLNVQYNSIEMAEGNLTARQTPLPPPVVKPGTCEEPVMSCTSTGRPKLLHSQFNKRGADGGQKMGQAPNLYMGQQAPMYPQRAQTNNGQPAYQMPMYANNQGYFMHPQYFQPVFPVQMVDCGPIPMQGHQFGHHQQQHQQHNDLHNSEYQNDIASIQSGSPTNYFSEIPEDLTQVMLNNQRKNEP